MTGRIGRTTPCNRADARARLDDATAFLAAADRVIDLGGDVVATNAVHAAIAAADVLCCTRLGTRSRDPDHQAAVRLLDEVDPALGKALERALVSKNRAAYDSRDVSDGEVKACARAARGLVEAARKALVDED